MRSLLIRFESLDYLSLVVRWDHHGQCYLHVASQKAENWGCSLHWMEVAFCNLKNMHWSVYFPYIRAYIKLREKYFSVNLKKKIKNHGRPQHKLHKIIASFIDNVIIIFFITYFASNVHVSLKMTWLVFTLWTDLVKIKCLS